MLYSFTQPLTEAIVIKRPSTIIKSPYVADIMIVNKHSVLNTQNKFLGHCPSLGCCGLCEKESNVLVSQLSEKTKCDYRAELSILTEKNDEFGEIEIIIGMAPKLAESIVYEALKKNLIQNLQVKTIQREKTLLNSRFDFVGQDIDNNYYILEVKTVPLAKYNDEFNIPNQCIDLEPHNIYNKTAYFPDGYRKNKTLPVSERAIKHLNDLTTIKNKYPNVRCILLFVIQRNDVRSFQPSRLDKEYLKTIQYAWENDVEIKTLQVEWTRDGTCHFIRNDLPIYLYDDCNFDIE